jgi:glycerophosphoryl diester phosphodiesterase
MELIKKIHQVGIAGIFGTLGNIDQQAVAKGNQIYDPIIRAEVDIIATDRPIAVHHYLNTLKK